MIPYGRQSINQADIDSVVDVLKSDFITQGPVVSQFEQAIADYCQVKYSIAVCNATVALHLACLSLDVGKDDIVWTSPNTFVASANCVLYCGAKVDFVDIDPNTYNLSVEKLKEKLIIAKQKGTLPKVLIPVHFAGQSCEMKEIKKLADNYGFSIIEDAAHAIGGEYQGHKIGCCEYSDITIFSFHPVKIMTTGEGGMLLTNNSTLANKVELLKNSGITKDPKLMTGDYHGSWYYQQLELGYNYRMTDIQAALGLSQLKRLDKFVHRRKEIAEIYSTKIVNPTIKIPWQHPDADSSWHLYVICLQLDKLSSTKKQIFNHLHDIGIGVHVHYIPVHTQPYYQQYGFKIGDFPVSENYYQQAITLPLYFDMKEKDLNYIIKIINQIE